MRIFKISDTKFINLDRVTMISVDGSGYKKYIYIHFGDDYEYYFSFYYSDDLWNRLLKAMGINENEN